MAITKQGTRVVQAALDIAEPSEKLSIIASLKGRVWSLGLLGYVENVENDEIVAGEDGVDEMIGN